MLAPPAIAVATLVASTGTDPMFTSATPDSVPRFHAATPTIAQS